MSELYFEGEFHRWPSMKFSYPGMWQKIGWRFFAISGSQATLEKVDTPLGAALRMERSSDVGDCGLDQDGEDLHTLLAPESSVFVRVWARRVKLPGVLEVRLAEFEGDEWTGEDNIHRYNLSDVFEPYTFQATTSSKTTEVCVALRIETTGSVEILRVELGPIESAEDVQPQILLPQGRTPNANPKLWWRGSGLAAQQVHLSKDITFKEPYWDSGWVERGASWMQLPELAPEQPVFARVRLRDFIGNRSPWSEPTLVVYTPGEILPRRTLTLFDLDYTRHLPPEEAFEQAHLVSALQGLANRQGPRMALKWIAADEFWLERLRQPGRWLEFAELKPSPSIEDLLERFADAFDGVVLWDPKVPATSNVASTIAGVENLLPIPLRDEPGSLYRRLVKNGPDLPVKRSLVGIFTGEGTIPDTGEPSSGSAKNDAYRWAIAQYLESGRCNHARMGYYIDYFWVCDPLLAGDFSNHTLTNHDFFIMHKGFLWDLSVWDDETPVDDPDQPMGTDYATLLRMLKSAADRLGPDEMIHCGGFTPWAWKYCQGRVSGGNHHAVQSEWETVRLLSAYNAVLDADALGLSSLSNASIWGAMPRPVRFNQSPPMSEEEMQRRGWLVKNEKTGDRVAPKTYLCHYVGDYDAAAWLTSQVPSMWEDFRRGQVTLPWAWNANLMERGMPMFDEFFHTRTPKDVLWSGDNGAGYLAPTQLFDSRPPSGLPDGSKRWQTRCRRYFRQLDQRHVGFIINGRAGALTPESIEMYKDFAGDGIVARETEVSGLSLCDFMPVVEMGHNGLPEDPHVSAREIAQLTTPGQCRFLTLRSVLREPSYYYLTNRALQRLVPDLDVEFLSPAEFFYLLRKHLGGENIRRAAFLYDTLKLSRSKKHLRGKLWLRNLGWECWEAEGDQAIQIAVEVTDSDERKQPTLIALPADIGPGQVVELKVDIPVDAGDDHSLLRIDLVQGEDGWFSESGNLPDARKLF